MTTATDSIPEKEITFEWEVRENDIPYHQHMIAGCIAGMIEHSMMFPFDNIKTHTQVDSNMRFSQIVRHLYKEGGIKAFYRGLGLVASGSMPAHAAFFSVYELARRQFGINDEEHHPYLFALTGAAATFLHDLIMTPIDVFKQRKQISDMPTKSLVRSMIRNEGFWSIFRSFPVTYMMNVPLSALIVSTNETLKIQMQKSNIKHNFFTYFGCAGIAGAVAATLTTPMDVIKTKLQTQDFYQKYCISCEKNPDVNKLKNNNNSTTNNSNKGQVASSFGFSSRPEITTSTVNCDFKNAEQFPCSKAKYTSILQTLKVVVAEEGVRGLFRGFGSRIIIFSPSSAISWATYETIKKYLNPLGNHQLH